MASPRLTALRRQIDEISAGISAIEDRAVSDGRDLTDAEQSDVDTLYDRAAVLKPEIDTLAAREESLQATAAVLAKVGGAPALDRTRPAAKDPEQMTAGEYFSEYFKAFATDGSGNPDQFIDRAIQYFDRADQITSDNAGVLPKPIVGQIIKFADSSRYVFGSLTSRPMPTSGKTFSRPRITQRVNVGEQAAELDPLASRKMTLVGADVSKRTFGGSLSISQQDIDWTDPSMLQIVIDDFAAMYAEITEGAACDYLEGLITTNTSLFDPTDVGTLVTSYVDAVVECYGTAKRMPDTIWHDLASWATLTSTTNANNDRTALSMIKEALSELGAGGMRWVVGPQLAADTRIVGVSSLIESYEQQKGLLQAVRPTALVHDIAYAGYLAFYGRAEGFVGLEAA